jgi:hypothetical protein
MTAAQIDLMLGYFGVDAGVWTSMPEVSSIVLDGDMSVYPCDSCQVYFDDAHQLIHTRRPAYPGSTEYTYYAFFPYVSVVAFYRTSPAHRKETYTVGLSV